MFWDRISSFYDFFETVYNGKVYNGLGKSIAKEINQSDAVLECACGTGAISQYIAPRCRSLLASDFSYNMLKRAHKKVGRCSNVRLMHADITGLKCKDDRFDKVVAGNVIHLLDDPKAAVDELVRVCKPHGKIIIPTYINRSGDKVSMVVRLLEMAGADFKRQYDFQSYKKFFKSAGYSDIKFYIVEGRMPCAVAVITKKEGNSHE